MTPDRYGHTTRVQAYADWNGRTPTSDELADYWAEGRRARRVRDLTHAIEDALKRNPALAAKLTPRPYQGPNRT